VDFASATAAYEDFLRQHISVVDKDLKKKHKDMHKDELAFFRATYYRWAQLFPKALPDMMKAPKINAVGDLHLENFGTFLSKEGRLVWGVNDFDESSRLPYTNDLVRLAASAVIGTKQKKSVLTEAEVCNSILDGYTKRMKKGIAKPFVLNERGEEDEEGHNGVLKRIVEDAVQNCRSWYKDMAPNLHHFGSINSLEPDAMHLLKDAAGPELAIEKMILKRRVAGLGSLGHQRIVAMEPEIAEQKKVEGNDCMAFELKETGPPAIAWLADKIAGTGTTILQSQAYLINNDPSRCFKGNWVIRRIAPNCIKLELKHLPMTKIDKILKKMGAETANIHITGVRTTEERESIFKDLESRESGWLENACSVMANGLNKDWKDYK
jgi:hypothetical protein